MESLKWQFFVGAFLKRFQQHKFSEALLLMAEILHQLIGSLSHYLQGFIHPRWCRISAINSRTLKLHEIVRYTPFSDRQQLGALRTLNCAGTVWILKRGYIFFGEFLVGTNTIVFLNFRNPFFTPKMRRLLF